MVKKVLIVDECPPVRLGLAVLLQSANCGARVVGSAGDAEDTLRLATELRPDLIFIEPNFTDDKPRGSTVPEIDLCKKLKVLPHSPRVVFHTVRNYPADVVAATLADADGFIHKSIQEEELIEAVEDILAGERVWLFGVGRKQADKLMRASMKVVCLSTREQEVLHLLLWRYSVDEMAAQLHIQPQTVKNHIVGIKRELGYKNRKELYEDWGV